MNLEKTLQKIRYLMSLFVTEIKAATAMQQTDINKLSENVVIPLFAEVYGYKNLKNLNFTEGSNFPGIDLADETARVAFQITSTPTLDKVKHTLEKFIEYKLYEKYDRLIIYILTEKQNSYSDTKIKEITEGKFTFDTKKDIWDSRNILEKVTEFQIEQARAVEKILEANFGEARRQHEWEVIDKIENIINEYTQLFVGRSQETQELDNFLHENSSGAMLLTAEAGFGKTALLANWLQSRQNNGCFIAYHFFSQRHEKTRSAKSAYKNLLRQLHIYYELYHEPQPDELDELRAAIYNILRERGARQDKLLIIVVDALGELNEVEIPFSLPFPTPLPDNVFVIASARASEAEEPKYLENWIEKSQKLHLKCLSKVAIADWLKRIGEGELAIFADDNHFVTKLDEITQGFPLYLSYLIDELSHAAKQQQDVYSVLAETPQGFKKYVKQQLNRLDELELPDERWQFFALLAVAKGVLEKDDIKVITQMRDRQLRKLHQCWQVTRWMKIIEGKYYAFAHPLLGTVFAKELGDDADDALQKLIDYCSDWQKHQSCYALRHYPQHLRDAKLWDDLYGLARNRDFLEVQSEQLLDEPDLPLKTMQIALSCAAEEDNPGLMAEFMLLHARWIEDTKVKESPLDALRKGSLERALKLVEIYEVERQILWYLLLVWELKDTDKLDEARAVLQRLQKKDLHNLSTHPGIDWQNNYAAYLLAHIFEVNRHICIVLSQKILDKRYHSLVCSHLRKLSNFDAAIEIAQTTISFELIPIMELESIAEAQVEEGKTQAARDSLAKALKMVHESFHNPIYVWKIGSIAKIQIEKLEDIEVARITFANAIEAATRTSEHNYQVWDFVNIANMQADVGMFSEALETLQKIDSQSAQENFLKDIAKVLIKAGKKDEAKITFANAVKIKLGVKDKEKQEDGLLQIVIAQTEVGQFTDALETAKLIDNQSKRSDACMKIALGQTEKKDFFAAIVTASIINELIHRVKAYETIATMQAEVKDLLSALITARKIEEPTIKARTLKTIAILQAQKSPLTNDALAIAQKIENESQRTEALVGIIKAQAESGKFDVAFRTKSKIEDKKGKIDALAVIAEAYARTTNLDNHFDEALKITEKIEPSWKRVRTLAEIAQIQAEAGQLGKARNTFATAFKSEFEPKPEISYLKAIALYQIAQVNNKNQQTEDAIAITCIIQKIAESIKNPIEKADVLAAIAELLVNAGKTEDALSICKSAFEIAQQIHKRDDLRSKIFQLIAQIQAKTGDVDAALETIVMINIENILADALKRLAKLCVKEFPHQIERLKEVLNNAHKFFENQYLPFSFWDIVDVRCTIAVGQISLEDKKSAQATFKELLDFARTSRYKASKLKTIAAAFAEIGDITTALKITNEIEDAREELRAFWAIAWQQFNKGEKVTTLDAAVKARNKIQDEKKQVESLSTIATIQALAGMGEEAMTTVEEIFSNRNKHLSAIASLYAEIGDKVNFKKLLIKSAYYLDASYEICGYLPRLYPQNAQAVAEVVKNLD